MSRDGLRDAPVVFRTNVGSHMWGMNHPGSDIDLFACHVVSTKELLMGTASTKSYQDHSLDLDVSGYEAGKVVEQLISGNVNFYWGVLSPIVVDDSEWLSDLRDIVRANPSSKIFHSSYGLAKHNYKKYIEGGDPRGIGPDMITKKCNILVRTLRFAVNYLLGDGFRFDGEHDCTPGDVRYWMEHLRDVYDDCVMEDAPNALPYRRWLYELRMCELEGGFDG